jgi:hypothetical protein
MITLSGLGWRPSFSGQLSLDELESTAPARIISRVGEHLTAFTENGEFSFHLPGKWLSNPASDPLTLLATGILLAILVQE